MPIVPRSILSHYAIEEVSCIELHGRHVRKGAHAPSARSVAQFRERYESVSAFPVQDEAVIIAPTRNFRDPFPCKAGLAEIEGSV